MKNRILIKSMGAVAALALSYGPALRAAEERTLAPAPGPTVESKPSTVIEAAPAPVVEAPMAPEKVKDVHLSPAAAEVLKLARAKVSEGTIIAFIMNSGSSYNLSVSEIIYLREQGVSDFVITTMLDQSRKLTDKYHNSANSKVAMVFTNGVQTAPLTPSGTSYTVPDSVPGYYYDDSYGYYPNYGYYYGPGLVFGIGIGGPPRGPGFGPRPGGPRPGGPGPGGHPGGPGPGGPGGGGGRPGGPGGPAGGPGGGHGGGGPGGGGPGGGHR